MLSRVRPQRKALWHQGQSGKEQSVQMLKAQADALHPKDEKQPAHQEVYQQLRSKVLFGDLIPGQPVTLQGLADDLGAGMTPVREAVRRMIANGALSLLGNRRVIVPPLTLSDLEQLEFMRKTLEVELLRRAMPQITCDHILALQKLDERLNAAILHGDITRYLTFNYQFHHRLYAHADAPILVETVDRLWLRFGPSLRVVCGRFGTLNLPDCHADLIAALRSGAEQPAVDALCQDIAQGMNQMRAMLDHAPITE